MLFNGFTSLPYTAVEIFYSFSSWIEKNMEKEIHGKFRIPPSPGTMHLLALMRNFHWFSQNINNTRRIGSWCPEISAQKVFISVAFLWMPTYVLMTWKVKVGKEETAQENPDLKVKNVRREVYGRRIGFA